MSSISDIKRSLISDGVVAFNSSEPLCDVAQRIGKIIKDPVSGKHLDIISNSKMSRSNPKHLSYGYDSAKLPFHNDYPNMAVPPRIVLLRCLEEGSVPIETQYVSLKSCKSSDIFGALIREPWLIRSGLSRWKRTKVVSYVSGGEILVRFSSNVMKPFFPKKSTLHILGDFADHYFTKKVFVLKAGECLLMDNWSGLHRRMIHKNKGISVYDDKKNRVLERALIG